MSWQDPLSPLGLRIDVLVAGLAGGFVRWAIRPRPGGIIPNLVMVGVGAITAAYLTPVGMHWIASEIGTGAPPEQFMLAAAYLSGMIAQWGVEAAIMRTKMFGRAVVDSLQYADGEASFDEEEPQPRRKRRHEEDGDLPEAG
jgi:hypothetical protein